MSDELSQEDRQAVLDEFRAIQAEVDQAGSDAVSMRRIADEITTSVRHSAELTSKRTSYKWLAPIMIASVIVGALVAGLLSLVIFVQAAAVCEDTSGVCRWVTPESVSQEKAMNELVVGILGGVEYINNGGTLDAYLSGVAASEADLVIVIAPDGDGTWTIRAADGTSQALVATQLNLVNAAGRPQEDVFSADGSNAIILAKAQHVLDTGEPAEPLQLRTESGLVFTSRVVPLGPNTVAIFTTIVDD